MAKVNGNDPGGDIFSHVTGEDDPSEIMDDGDDGADDGGEGNDELPADLRDARDRQDDDGLEGDDDDGAQDQRQERASQREQRRPPREQQPQVRARKADPFDPRTRLGEDRAGNLMGPDGQVIARKGRERQNFERWRKVAQADRSSAITMAQRLTRLATEAKTLYTAYNTLKAQRDIFDEGGLSFDDKKTMLELAVAYKRSPIEGLKLMLTKAHMAGVDIKQITGVDAGFNPSVIIDAVKSHIDAKLKPVEDLTSQREDQSSAEAEAAGFFDRNPLARDVSNEMGNQQFAGLMGQAKRKFPHLSLDDIWQKIHYQIILRNGDRRSSNTGPVTHKRTRQSQRPRPARDETFEDIGQSVLRDIQQANARSRQ